MGEEKKPEKNDTWQALHVKIVFLTHFGIYTNVYTLDLNCWFARSEKGSVEIISHSTVKDGSSFIFICYRTVHQKLRLKPSITPTAQSATRVSETMLEKFELHTLNGKMSV